MAARSMTYVGALRGEGVLVSTADRSELGRAEYDIGAFRDHSKELVASGELRMSPDALEQAFGRPDLLLQTDSGLSLEVRFSGKRLAAGTDAAHVDVTQGLPAPADWPE
jgi:hypothetical protein